MSHPTGNLEIRATTIRPSFKKRQISDIQRKALRDWAHNQQCFPSQRACTTWFYAQYGHKLSQSTVSHILSPRYRYLDSRSDPSTSLRRGTGQWQDLEIMLYGWHQTLTLNREHVSGHALIKKAREIWSSLPQYRNQPPPSFSSGWLHRFKHRYSINQPRPSQTEEAYPPTEAVPAPETRPDPKKAKNKMKAIRTIAGDYNEKDIYNLEETGLFWRMPPFPTPSLSSNQPGVKLDKSRISLIFCVNASGVDRLPVWVIGKICMPRALRNINMETMGIRWRSSITAWADQMIMKEWLLSFYSHIGSRSVLLTMDNFPAHLAGLELAPPPSNVRICWLPKNSMATTQCRPPGQGIIQNFKIYYRKQWLKYILDCYYEGIHDPLQNVTLLDCVRWIVRAWNNYVLNTTISSCFLRSTLVLHPIQLPNAFPDLSLLYEKVQQFGPDPPSGYMDVDNFLNPREEASIPTSNSELSPNVLLEHFIPGEPSDTGEEDDSAEPMPLPSSSEALSAVRLLISYLEGQDVLKACLLRPFERLERDLESKVDTLRPAGAEFIR